MWRCSNGTRRRGPTRPPRSRSAGTQALAIACDVGDKAAVDAAVAAVVERFGRIDVVINNAQAVTFTTVLETTDDDADVMWRSGFLGTLHVMQAAHPHLLKTQGNIINVISGAMLGGFGKSGVYGSVKAALRTLTRAGRHRVGPAGHPRQLHLAVGADARARTVEEGLPRGLRATHGDHPAAALR